MSEWTRHTLAEVADIRISNVDKKETEGQKPVRLCNYMDVYSNSYISGSIEFMEATASPEEIIKFKVSKGDVLITKDSETPFDIGIPSVVVEEIEDLVCGYHLALIKPDKQKVDSIFLSKILASKVSASYFSRLAAGSTRYGLSNGAIANTPVSIPGLAHQKRVAGILENIDRAIEKIGSLVKKYQRVKIGLMHDLFTRGVDSDGKLRRSREQAPELYQSTPVGWVPKGWSYRKLGEVLLKIESGWSPDCIERPPSVGEWGVLKVSAVTRGCYDYLQSKTLPDALYPRFELEVKAGDIIMTRANGVAELVGKCVQVGDTQEKLMLSDKLLRLVPCEGIMSKEFLGMLMNSDDIKSQIRSSMNGSSGQRNISQGDIRGLFCFVPSLDEQKAICSPLIFYQQLIDREVEYVNKLCQQRCGLMRDLLVGESSPLKLQPDEHPEASHV